MPQTPSSQCRPLAFLFFLAGLTVAGIVASAPADVVILRDGFVIQGNVRKEMEAVNDRAIGQVLVPKGNGFDMIDDGPRIIIFSSHEKQLKAISKDVKIRPDYRAFLNRFEFRKSNHPFPGFIPAATPPEFDAKWKRTVKVLVPGGFELIQQQVTYLDPYCCFIVSPTHLWSQSFRTSEMVPQTVRKLLSTHPELAEADGKPDPVKRIAIARFMKDVGWLYLAKEELDQLKKVVPGALAKEAQDEFDRLQKDLDAAVAELVTNEAKSALSAGRYKYATDVLAAFPEKTAGPKEMTPFIELKARLETVRDQYATCRRLLRTILDELTGLAAAQPYLAIGGGPVATVFPEKKFSTRTSMLVAAAEVVYTEVHPDTISRVEFFISLAAQAEREKSQGKEPTKTPEELLATVVSGWVKGKNGATPMPDLALRLWRAREVALAYQRAPTRNSRAEVLATYKRSQPLEGREVAQVISLLPPAEPENLAARSGTPVKAVDGVPEGVYKRRSGSFGNHPAGIEYFVRLPPEYHHGRAYPVIVLLNYPEVPAERLMGAIAPDADKNGYIVIAPEWCPAFGPVTGWQWNAEDHDFALAPLRDAIRHFTIDNDKVFMLGAGIGGDMALDVGVSHPDQFAGVFAMGLNPKWQGFMLDYWQNAQKLPFYVVTGQMAGEENKKTRLIFERWMPNGFPALHVVYKGRGLEWFPAEIPIMFDWMNRKTRANGTSTLRIGTMKHLSWKTSRESDNRFYWLGAEEIDQHHLAANVRPGQGIVPAEMKGDIQGNRVIVDTMGVRKVSVWLAANMIDWSQPVSVSVKSNPYPWKARVIEQDLGVLLEDYWVRGDRRMLYLARLEFESRE